jgi:hypothetical protein
MVAFAGALVVSQGYIAMFLLPARQKLTAAVTARPLMQMQQTAAHVIV